MSGAEKKWRPPRAQVQPKNMETLNGMSLKLVRQR
jgi:hypothetical protein